MEVVCQSSPINVMVLVFQSTSPVTACAMTKLIRSTVKENALIPDMKKKRLSKVDVKVRYRVVFIAALNLTKFDKFVPFLSPNLFDTISFV